MAITQAIEALRAGKIILVFDGEGRENETDLVIGAKYATPEVVTRFRKDAGGLLCVALGHWYARSIGLPYMAEVYLAARKGIPLISKLVPAKLPYDEKSAFSLNVNHKDCYTGINDNDRSLTVRGIVGLTGTDDFLKRFISPGHVHLLIGAKNGVDDRRGHTELTLAIAELAGIAPATMIAEMLDDNGKSLSKSKAIEYAKKNKLAFVEGKEIVSYVEKHGRKGVDEAKP